MNKWNANEAAVCKSQAAAADLDLKTEGVAIVKSIDTPFWQPTKRLRLSAAQEASVQRDVNSKVFDLFVESKMSMREGLIRVLEQRIDTSVLKRESQTLASLTDDAANAVKKDEDDGVAGEL